MRKSVVFFAAVVSVLSSFADLTVENARFTLVVGNDAIVKSLRLKGSDEELLDLREPTPLFSVVQARPFDNEDKLMNPCGRTVYPANSIELTEGRWTVGFRGVSYRAVIAVEVKNDFAVFKPSGFMFGSNGLNMDYPPVKEFRILQLPVKNRKNFGSWLNCAWDNDAAVCVAGTSPYTVISNEERTGYRILCGDIRKGIKLIGSSAALIAAKGKEEFLDAMDAFERELGLPRGVKNRRDPMCGESIYHTCDDVTPATVNKAIAIAKAGGFKRVTMGYGDMCKKSPSWGLCGDYDWRDDYPNKEEDLKQVLAKFHEEGIKVGFHILPTHVGLESRYVTPKADPRLALKNKFTLKSPLPASADDCEITVYESTQDVEMFPKCRILRFGTELISYESCTYEPPYTFKGCKRGAWKTDVVEHSSGEAGGVLHISEYGKPCSCYVAQESDLQDEICEKLAHIYNCGFDYLYIDGSEGVDEPYEINIALSQYRLWKLCKPEPQGAESAARTHFSWHMISEGNAFDCFPPDVFKENIVKFPVAEAPLIAQDMTHCDFGWWNVIPPNTKDWSGKLSVTGTTPELWEFGCSKAAEWNSPVTILFGIKTPELCPQAPELLDSMRRFNEARRNKQ